MGVFAFPTPTPGNFCSVEVVPCSGRSMPSFSHSAFIDVFSFPILACDGLFFRLIGSQGMRNRSGVSRFFQHKCSEGKKRSCKRLCTGRPRAASSACGSASASERSFRDRVGFGDQNKIDFFWEVFPHLGRSLFLSVLCFWPGFLHLVEVVFDFPMATPRPFLVVSKSIFTREY